MLNIQECLDKYNIKIEKISYYEKYIIIDSGENKYLLKQKDSNKEELFNYLRQINYNYFMPLLNDYNDYFELYPYYEDNISGSYTKARELLYALAILHLKTTTYLEYNQDELKEIYENTNILIDTLTKYYLDLQDYLEGIEFLSPAQYLLIKNISRVHYLLRLSKQNLEDWFSDLESVREVLLLNNVSLNNFRFGDRSYFVDFKEAKNGLVVYDLVTFYKNEVLNVDFYSLFNFYLSKYHLNKDELELFYTLICIPERITFTKNNYQDTLKVRKLIDYVEVTLNFLLEKNKEYQKAYQEKLEEENENV